MQKQTKKQEISRKYLICFLKNNIILKKKKDFVLKNFVKSGFCEILSSEKYR